MELYVLFGSYNSNANGSEISSFTFPYGNMHSFNSIPFFFVEMTFCVSLKGHKMVSMGLDRWSGPDHLR
jgi:hypothetical protein